MLITDVAIYFLRAAQSYSPCGRYFFLQIFLNVEQVEDNIFNVICSKYGDFG